MRVSKSITILGFFIAKGSYSLPPKHLPLEKRMGDPVVQICYPSYDEYIISGSAPLLIDSPYPCEVQAAMEFICSPNGTTTLDFLAEQECLCNGAFYDVSKGCSNCFFVNGEGERTPSDAIAYFSALSAAECNALPTHPYSSVAATFSPPPPKILSNSSSSAWPTYSQRPTDTAVTGYWTPTSSVTIGAITGSATARATTNIRWSIIEVNTPPSMPTPSKSTSSGAVATIGISLSNTSGARKAIVLNTIGTCTGLLIVLSTFIISL